MTHLADIPEEHSNIYCEVCCVDGNIYLVEGREGGLWGCVANYTIVTEYNPRTNTWRVMPRLQEGRCGHSVCTLDSKIFALGGYRTTSCEVLDLGEDDPKWRFIASMDSDHSHSGGVLVVNGKIYVLGGDLDTSVDVYDVDLGMLRRYYTYKIYILSSFGPNPGQSQKVRV